MGNVDYGTTSKGILRTTTKFSDWGHTGVVEVSYPNGAADKVQVFQKTDEDGKYKTFVHSDIKPSIWPIGGTEVTGTDKQDNFVIDGSNIHVSKDHGATIKVKGNKHSIDSDESQKITFDDGGGNKIHDTKREIVKRHVDIMAYPVAMPVEDSNTYISPHDRDINALKIASDSYINNYNANDHQDKENPNGNAFQSKEDMRAVVNYLKNNVVSNSQGDNNEILLNRYDESYNNKS